MFAYYEKQYFSIFILYMKCSNEKFLFHNNKNCRSLYKNNALKVYNTYILGKHDAQWPIFRKSWTKSKKKIFEILK